MNESTAIKRFPPLLAAQQGIKRLGPDYKAIQVFLLTRLQPDGGFSGRGPASDLYYTSFGLDLLTALAHPFRLPRVHDFVARFGTGEGLDFMHLISLARCWARLPSESDGSAPPPLRGAALLDRLAAYTCPDGAYNTVAGAPIGSATANYLVATVCQDLGMAIPTGANLVQSLTSLRSADGAYANLPGLAAGTTLATAAALTLQHAFAQPLDWPAAQWLLDRFTEDGGCLSTPGAPIPDLLSTATAVLAFHMLGLDTSEIAPACLAFVDSLKQRDGGYSGHRLDATADCEYTFYALMTMGCLWEPGN